MGVNVDTIRAWRVVDNALTLLDESVKDFQTALNVPSDGTNHGVIKAGLTAIFLAQEQLEEAKKMLVNHDC